MNFHPVTWQFALTAALSATLFAAESGATESTTLPAAVKASAAAVTGRLESKSNAVRGATFPSEQHSAGKPRAVRSTGPTIVNCTAAGPCPEIQIIGDPPATLPNGRPAPARGYADPTMRRDPLLGMLWMAYSWPHMRNADDIAVEQHLARSDDDGVTWRFVRRLWQASSATDEQGAAGFLNSETASFAPGDPASTLPAWFFARISYFVPDGGLPKLSSWTIRVGSASSPQGVTEAEESILGGAGTNAHWRPDVNLGALAPELRNCVFSDPGLLYANGTLCLAAQCMVYGPSGERPEEELVALFATTPSGRPTAWQWRYLGALASRADAVALGGSMLQQTELAISRDGKPLAILTASEPGEIFAIHEGCRVIEIESLDQARLARFPDGRLRERTSILVTDQPPHGPGACTYDPASSTGVVIVRRQVQPELVVDLRASGIHP